MEWCVLLREVGESTVRFWEAGRRDRRARQTGRESLKKKEMSKERDWNMLMGSHHLDLFPFQQSV